VDKRGGNPFAQMGTIPFFTFAKKSPPPWDSLEGGGGGTLVEDVC